MFNTFAFVGDLMRGGLFDGVTALQIDGGWGGGDGGATSAIQLGALFPAGFDAANDAEFNDVFGAANHDYLSAIRFGAI